jgi:hypothetical protein
MHSFERLPKIAVLTLSFFLLVAGRPATPLLAQQKSSASQKLPAAEKVVENYLKAIGGKKRAAAIQDATYDWTIKSQNEKQGVAKIQIKAPAAVRSEINFDNGQVISAANPRSAWVRGLDGQLRTLTGAEGTAAKLHAALDAVHLVDYKKSNVLARVADVSETPAGPAYVVEFSARGGGHLKYLFSITTKLLLGIQDEARKTSTWFDDYRSEGSILEPHSVRLTADGADELRWSLTKATYNSGLVAAVFDPPRSAEAEDVAALLREVSKNQDEVEKRVTEYSFLQKETDREIDSKGVVKKETVKVSEVFPIPNRGPVEKLISENGVPLSPERAAKEDKRVQEEFEKAERDKDKDAQKAAERRAKRDREKTKSGNDEDGDPEISAFFKNCEFVSPRRERFQDRETMVFDFRVKPGFKPSTREENLISKLVGVVWIDPLDKQVIRLEARLAEGFKMAGGLLFSLRPGAALIMEQTRMIEGLWLPRLAQLNLSLKVLLFGGTDINKTIQWSDYKHFSAGVEGYKINSPPTGPPTGNATKKKP